MSSSLSKYGFTRESLASQPARLTYGIGNWIGGTLLAWHGTDPGQVRARPLAWQELRLFLGGSLIEVASHQVARALNY